MVEIEIKFPKSPKTPQRRRIQNIGKKYNYHEDDYFSIIKISDINNELMSIVEGICTWKDNECFIDGQLIDTRYLLNLIECTLIKEDSNKLKWYYDGYDYHSLIRSYETFEDLRDALNEENKPRDSDLFPYKYDFDIPWSLKTLVNVGMIKVLIPKKEWNIEKDDILEDIKTKMKIIKRIYPEFDIIKVLETIGSFPNKIIIDTFESEIVKEEIEDPEGEEWVDWYHPIKYKKKVLDLLTKIEENTRK